MDFPVAARGGGVVLSLPLSLSFSLSLSLSARGIKLVRSRVIHCCHGNDERETNLAYALYRSQGPKEQQKTPAETFTLAYFHSNARMT